MSTGRLADRADAAGISDTASARTGSVVERLIAPDAASTPDSIVHIPIKYVVPHPRNRKIHDDDVADLVAEFKAGIPMLNAIGVTAAADWNANRPAELKEIGPLEFIITAGGHRRLRAAELAGLPTVPCVVRANFAGAEGRKAALLENLHRQDLDAFEEAAAFEELTTAPYKLSQRDLASIVGCNQSHISKRLKLLKLPSTIRAKVRLGQMTLADAIALAGIVDNTAVFDLAMHKIDQGHYGVDTAVRTAQREHDTQVQRQRITDEITAAGGRILDRRPAWYASSKTEPTRLSDLELDETKHAGEECHVTYIDDGSFNGKVQPTPVCERPGRHTKTGVSTLKVRKSVDDRLGSRGGGGDTEAEARRERREHKKLWPARALIARQVVNDPELDVAVETELITRGVLGNTFDDCGAADTWKALIAILGVEDPIGYPNEEARDDLVRRLPARTVQRAVALSYFEARLRSTWKTWGSDGRYYLDLLTAHGYTIDRLEKKKLGKPKATKTRACRVCGHEHLEPGVTWVADDLCSGCSDAQEAGWVAADTAAAILSATACLECEHDQPADSCTCPHCFCNSANVDEPATAVAG